MTVLSRSLDVAAQLRALEPMDVAGLRAEWRRLYRSTPPKRVSRELLVLGVAWKIQERVQEGSAPPRTAGSRPSRDPSHKTATSHARALPGRSRAAG